MTIFKWELVPSKLEAALMWRSTAPSSRPKVPGPGWEKAADYSDYCCPESGQAVALPTVSSPCLALFLHRSVKPLWGWTRASHAGHSAQWPAHGGHWVPGICFFFFSLSSSSPLPSSRNCHSSKSGAPSGLLFPFCRNNQTWTKCNPVDCFFKIIYISTYSYTLDLQKYL